VRILITGGAGFIGSHLCEHFLARDVQVIAMDNLLTGSLDNIKHISDHPSFTFIRHDVSTYIELGGDLDAVLHFASPASPIDYLKFPIQTLKVGALGTHNTLGLALSKGAKYLLASTSEVYGDPLVHPQPETYVGNVDTIGPRGVYDEAKRYAEAMVMAYHRVHDLDTRIVRIFNTYGPRMRLDDGRVVPNFIAQALRQEPLTVYGDGQQTRSFQYVQDLVNGIVKLLETDYNEPVNIGNPSEMTIKQFAEVVNKLTDNPAGIVIQEEKRIQGDPQTRQPDISRAKSVLDWQPQVDLADGLDRTIRYFSEVV
jgi:dTDP-glucose 4,6-dehydratase